MSNEQLDKLLGEIHTLAETFFEEINSGGGSKQHSWVIDSTTKNNGH